MILAECRGETVVVMGLGPKDHLRVVRWPNGVLSREPEDDLTNERVVEDEAAVHAARLMREDPEHPRVTAARGRVQARRKARS